MIKSTINTNADAAKKPVYPLLRWNRHKKYVVLFYSECTGTVVAREDGAIYTLGYHSDTWFHPDNTDYWTPLASGESVTLTVE